MAPFERALVDLMTAFVGEDPVARYDAARRAAVVGPGSLPHAMWGEQALRLNRPREAIRILSGIDPQAPAVNGWAPYWFSLTEAYHTLGRHRSELRQARRAQALHPNDTWPLLVEARALAALGRLTELEALLRARLSLPDHRDPPPGVMMTVIGHELRVHGHQCASREWLARAAEWYGTRPAEEQAQVGQRRQLAFALLAMERPVKAEAIFHELAAEDPDDVGVTSVLGVLAARRGDAAEADRIAGWLATLRRPYHNGEQLLWRACIAAQRGDAAAAVSLLQEAAGRAAHFEHTHFCLDPLRHYPPFRELLRPQG